MQKLAVIGAMTVETDELVKSLEGAQEFTAGAFKVTSGKIGGTELLVCCCGVGKVHAAAATGAILAVVSGIDAVINVGVAGGIGAGIKQGDVVIADKCVQHDYDATPDGLKKGQVHNFDCEFFNCDKDSIAAMEKALKSIGLKYHVGTIASGDQFINSSAKAKEINGEFAALACDMESGAIAQVCAIYKVPFLSMRAISDGGDDGAVVSFYEFLMRAVKNSTAAITAYVKQRGQ